MPKKRQEFLAHSGLRKITKLVQFLSFLRCNQRNKTIKVLNQSPSTVQLEKRARNYYFLF